ncbi:Desumoylating isopeptidase 1 [Auxenochlorella protothecoides]|uniref:Desumoylating isopeptidase 1 n=1 Tax=Auxenochlorella protothecoides TaxID=3075 RepID=A0A087STE0_AUXPR|nr:Desumoylating isopeptidase 1 [Auxenochlorella protothecoides]KFM28994.1 Desumoylating isopeptidase 1 [Auxenochlorella protothecoides]
MSDGEAVQLYVYDLSRGLAKVFSPMLLDKTIEGVWHTSIVVGGTEYFYGHGINSATPGTTPCGTPVEVIELGRTHLDSGTRDALLADLSERYSPAAYSLFDNNCNNFSDDFARLLVGEGIPAHITALPEELLAQQLAAALTGTSGGTCAGDEPTSPRTLERDVDAAITRTMEEAAALALQHEAQRLAGQQPLHGAGLLDGGS